MRWRSDAMGLSDSFGQRPQPGANLREVFRSPFCGLGKAFLKAGWHANGRGPGFWVEYVEALSVRQVFCLDCLMVGFVFFLRWVI